MSLDASTFQRQFVRFDARVFHRSEPHAHFASFREGFPDESESYKLTVRRIARDRLGFNQWRKTDIGTGQILERVIAAIEINGGPDILRNNLVAWQERYGPEQVSHRALVQAAARRGTARIGLERWFYDFFCGRVSDRDAFESFLEMAGRSYDLVAYLFFLKDSDEFLPIATRTFDKAFELLRIPLRTAQRCSWENYRKYNAAVGEIRDALRGIDPATRLIDAHTFCWILVRSEYELPASTRTKVSPPILLKGLSPAPRRGDSAGREPVVVTQEEFASREEARRRSGHMAELHAIESERMRLRSEGRADLAAAVDLVADQPALGYDVKSFEVDGRPRHIEVKSVRMPGRRIDFAVTRNELKKSRSLPNYWFYLVDLGSRAPVVFMCEADQVSDACLTTIQYLASLERKPNGPARAR